MINQSYYFRVQSNDAIRYVRLKRPNAVQTRRQIACVKEFETYFLPQCIIYRLCKNILDNLNILV